MRLVCKRKRWFMLVVGIQLVCSTMLVYHIYKNKASTLFVLRNDQHSLHWSKFLSTSLETDPRKTSTTLIKSFVDLPTNFNYTHAERKIKFHILWFNPSEWVTRRNKRYKLDTCEYNNCQMIEDMAWLHNSSAVIFVTTNPNMGRAPPVSSSRRNPNQIWIFESMEPPIYHIFQRHYKYHAWNNTMNWSMTFNFDSDVFEPFGTFKPNPYPREPDYSNIYDMKTKMAVWVVSNCGSMNRRNEYVTALQHAGVKVDIYGKCSGKGIYKGDFSDLARQYKFYLSFENSFCKYYVTEKVYLRYNLNFLLVTRGGADYSRLLPNGTVIDTALFPNVSSLARYLVELGSDKQRYIDMLRRKDKYIAWNGEEFGHPFGMCNLCKALNEFDGNRKTYSNIEEAMVKLGRCKAPKDVVIE